MVRITPKTNDELDKRDKLRKARDLANKIFGKDYDSQGEVLSVTVRRKSDDKIVAYIYLSDSMLLQEKSLESTAVAYGKAFEKEIGVKKNLIFNPEGHFQIDTDYS
ncbi:MAG: hypothetical protein ABIB79_04755 [archaeon]